MDSVRDFDSVVAFGNDDRLYHGRVHSYLDCACGGGPSCPVGKRPPHSLKHRWQIEGAGIFQRPPGDLN